MTVKENVKIAGEIVLNDSSHGTDLALYMLNFSEGSKHIFTFLSFPHIDMTQVVGIIPGVRQGLAYFT